MKHILLCLLFFTILCNFSFGQQGRVFADGMADRQQVSNSFSEAYPNPANTSVNFNSSFDSKLFANTKIIIRSLLGAIVKEVYVEENQREISIKTENIAEGLYFYSIIVNNEAVRTKKLIIKH